MTVSGEPGCGERQRETLHQAWGCVGKRNLLAAGERVSSAWPWAGGEWDLVLPEQGGWALETESTLALGAR